MEDECLAQNDKELAEKLLKDNYEQFKTLVRMHLSFELDLNTDELDDPNHQILYIEKGKMKYWNRLSKKIKGCAISRANSPTEENAIYLTDSLIAKLDELKQFLLKNENVIQEGIFRRTGAVSRQNDLKNLIKNNEELNLDKNYTVHDCATVYKSFLADMPEPVLTDAHYPAHCQIADLQINIKSSHTNEIRLLHSVQLLLLLLPETNRKFLENIIKMLHIISKHEQFNKMTADSLSTLFTPHLICPRQLPPEALHYISQKLSGVISYMIIKGSIIFRIPSKLATDIRAYFLDQKRKKTMSPDNTLDQSISDISTANTIYTFVDREKTAEAHISNPTDTELAQLYAHIQTMPESSKKRKLIKQFNKENGQGTPLQFMMHNRIKNSNSNKNSKSIGDSIKKHIFHKNMLKTPKRRMINTNFDTPNGHKTTTKFRILFHTPNTSPLKNTLPLVKHPLQTTLSTSTVSSLIKDDLSSNASSSSNLEETEKFQSENNLLINSSSDELSQDFKKNCLQILHKNEIQNFRLTQYQSEPDLYRLKTEYFDKSLNIVKPKKYKSLENIFITNEIYRKSKKRNFISQSCFSLEENITTIPIKSSRNENTLIFDNEIFEKSIDDKIVPSTPYYTLKRKSMSPITKSTQRMPKSMQESIMTPRSRKPVMLSALGIRETNQNIIDEDFVSNEKTNICYIENSSNNDNSSEDYNAKKIPGEISERHLDTALTSTFREYLLSRSVLTTSPVDSSFSSQSDDYASDIRDFDDSEVSRSLMYCLDGNEPGQSSSIDDENQIEHTNANNEQNLNNRIKDNHRLGKNNDLCETTL